MCFLFSGYMLCCFFFFFSSRRRHTRLTCDWSSDVCSSDLRGRDGAQSGGEPVESSCQRTSGPVGGERLRRGLREPQDRSEGVTSSPLFVCPHPLSPSPHTRRGGTTNRVSVREPRAPPA